MKESIVTANAPAAIGPYSQAVQAGNTIYVSGQLPIDPKTGAFAGEDIIPEAAGHLLKQQLPLIAPQIVLQAIPNDSRHRALAR